MLMDSYPAHSGEDGSMQVPFQGKWRGAGATEFFARPYTAKGLRLVLKNAFRPVTQAHGIGALYCR